MSKKVITFELQCKNDGVPTIRSCREGKTMLPISSDMEYLMSRLNPWGLTCVKELMQSAFLLAFLENRELPLIEVDSYQEFMVHAVSHTVYALVVRIHADQEAQSEIYVALEAVLQVAKNSIKELMNPPDPKLWWVHKVWADIVLRIFDAKIYEDQITNTYDLVQYLDSEEAEAQSASSAGYLYGLSCVRKALESVLPEHTKYSNLELLISLVNKIRATNQSLSEIKSSKEFKLACDAVDEV